VYQADARSADEGKALPEGPEDSVEVAEVSQQEPRIAVMV